MRLRSESKVRRDTLVVLAIGLAARLFALWLAIAHNGPTWLFTRGVEVGFVADSLLKGHGFASPFGGNTGPTALIAPGYPLLIAGVFKIFGTYSVASAMFIMLAQLLLNLGTIVLIMQLARRLANERAAQVAGGFWACWPPLLWMPTIFWETSLSAFLLAGMLLFALHVAEHPTRARWAYFGIIWGLAALINMALLISFSGIFIWLVITTPSKKRATSALAACLFLVVFSPWPLRNARVFHAFVPLRTTVGLELWMGNHDGASGYLEEAMFPLYNKAELAEYLRVGELGYDHEKSAAAHAWISAHSASFVELSGMRAVRYWIGTGSRNGSPIFLIGALLTSLGGAYGLYLLSRSDRKAMAFLFAIPLFCFPLPYYITHAEFRYRLVIDPILTVLASYALTAWRVKHLSINRSAPVQSIDQQQGQFVA